MIELIKTKKIVITCLIIFFSQKIYRFLHRFFKYMKGKQQLYYY